MVVAVIFSALALGGAGGICYGRYLPLDDLTFYIRGADGAVERLTYEDIKLIRSGEVKGEAVPERAEDLEGGSDEVKDKAGAESPEDIERKMRLRMGLLLAAEKSFERLEAKALEISN